MTDLTEKRLHEMLESLAGRSTDQAATLEDKVGAFYHSFMDEARVESMGVKPIEPELSEIKNAKSRDELAALMAADSDGFRIFTFRIRNRCRSKGSDRVRVLHRPGRFRSAGPGLLFKAGFRRAESSLPKLCRNALRSGELGRARNARQRRWSISKRRSPRRAGRRLNSEIRSQPTTR